MQKMLSYKAYAARLNSVSVALVTINVVLLGMLVGLHEVKQCER